MLAKIGEWLMSIWEWLTSSGIPWLVSIVSPTALVSLFFSIRSELRDTKKLDCILESGNKTIPIKWLYTNRVDHTGKVIQRRHPFQKEYNQVIEILLINPSSTAISYFDLEVIDIHKNVPLDFPVQFWVTGIKAENLSYEIPGLNRGVQFVPPPALYACIPGNSCLKISLAILAHKNDKIRISFKVCKHAFLGKKKHSRPSKYKVYSYEIDVVDEFIPSLLELESIARESTPSKESADKSSAARTGQQGESQQAQENLTDEGTRLANDKESLEDYGDD